MANDADDSPLGTVIDMESYRTSELASAADQTPRKTRSGPAGIVTEPYATPDPNGAGLVSEMEKVEIAKIRRNRDAGRLPTILECDFLLGLTERLTR
jgi:hypothetical protein